ncbi:MAG: ABC transporter permease subunit [Pirellulales bacterium]
MPIFDQGYQHWSGALSGHAWRWLSITRHGVRVCASGRWLRIFLLLAWLPAIGLAVMLCLWGLVERKSEAVVAVAPIFNIFFGQAIPLDPRLYRVEIWTLCYSYFLSAELSLSMILVMLVGPDLISQDLRYNALPLYFSRPLRRIDYFVGKLGVIVAFLGMVIIVPSIIAYLLGLLFSLDIAIVRDTYRILLASIAYGFLIALSSGLLILALSSLSRNSRYVALFWLGVWIVSGVVALVLTQADLHQHRRQAWVAQRAAGAGRPQTANSRRAFEDSLLAEAQQAAKSNWRPLVSYRANLAHLGNQMLGTNASVEKLSQLQPAQFRQIFLQGFLGTQYPWYWSAAVLAGLFGLSLCILKFSIKSLDRLR